MGTHSSRLQGSDLACSWTDGLAVVMGLAEGIPAAMGGGTDSMGVVKIAWVRQGRVLRVCDWTCAEQEKRQVEQVSLSQAGRVGLHADYDCSLLLHEKHGIEMIIRNPLSSLQPSTSLLTSY